MRYHYFDTARLFLMVIGVFYHVASMFSIDTDFVVYFDSRDSGFDAFRFVVHIFRMATFFIMSGFLGALLLSKFSGAEFLKKRVIRLLPPFLVGFFCINSGALLVVKDQAMLGAYYPDLHLWFIPVLLLFAILHVIFLSSDKLTSALSFPVKAHPKLLALLIVFLWGTFCFFFAHLMWRLPLEMLAKLTDGVVDFSEFGEYLPMYFGGALLFRYRNEMDLTLRQWPVYVLITLVYIAAHFERPDSLLAGEWLRDCTKIAMTLQLFAFFRYVIPASWSKSWMNNYSYSLYLLHEPIIIVLRSPVMKLFGGMTARYLVMVIATITISTVLHIIVSSSAVFRLLFNGEVNRPDAT